MSIGPANSSSETHSILKASSASFWTSWEERLIRYVVIRIIAGRSLLVARTNGVRPAVLGQPDRFLADPGTPR